MHYSISNPSEFVDRLTDGLQFLGGKAVVEKAGEGFVLNAKGELSASEQKFIDFMVESGQLQPVAMKQVAKFVQKSADSDA